MTSKPKAVAFLLILLAAPAARGLEVPARVAARETVIIERDHVEISHAPDAWILIDPLDPTVELTTNQAATPTTWHFWGPPGFYKIRELIPEPRTINVAYCEITTGTVDPDDPDPPPPPPNTLPVGAMILYQTEATPDFADKVNPAVRAVLTRIYGSDWRALDPDTPQNHVALAKPQIQRLFEEAKRRANGLYPFIFGNDGQTRVISQPLPLTAPETLRLLDPAAAAGAPAAATYCRTNPDGSTTCYDAQGRPLN